jgi:hypothetical protein
MRARNPKKREKAGSEKRAYWEKIGKEMTKSVHDKNIISGFDSMYNKLNTK